MGETPLLFTVSRPGWSLNMDEQVRFLAYLAEHIRDFAPLPTGLEAHVMIPHPYPVAISLYTRVGHTVSVKDIPDPDALEAKIAAFLDATGKDKMLELSAPQTLTWADISPHYDEVDETQAGQ